MCHTCRAGNDWYDISDLSILPLEIKDCIAPPALYMLEPPLSNISPLSRDSVTSEISVKVEACLIGLLAFRNSFNILPSEYQFIWCFNHKLD